MVDWFCKHKTESLLTIVSEPPPLLPEHNPDDLSATFYVEPERIVGQSSKEATPEDELVTILLSSMAGYIMKRYETQDCMKKVDIIKPIATPHVQEESSEEETVETEVKFIEKQSRLSLKLNTKNRRSKITKSGSPVAKTQRISKSTLDKSSFDGDKSTIGVDKSSRDIQHTVEGKHTEVEPNEEMDKEPEELIEVEELEKFQKIFRKSHKSMEEVDRKFCSWKFSELDQMVDIDFLHNNRYVGRMSRMLMEERGKFTWNNGQTYQGSFRRGYCDGVGLIEWNADSIYEGEVHCNFRHGRGVKTYLDLGKRMHHNGQWKYGKKHGQGVSVYDDDSKYDGNWENGQKSGFGSRIYSNGTRYNGQWYKGMRHGTGTMVWPNNDVYIGDWNFGQMHGNGKYIWNSFSNERLLSPLMNSYTGEWCQNKRHGLGVLQLDTGGIIKTHWYDDEKSGGAEIICRNGTYLHFEDLFVKDNVVPIRKTAPYIDQAKSLLARCFTNNNNAFKIHFHNDEIAEHLALSDKSLKKEDSNQEMFSVPVIPLNAPTNSMDFSMHITRLFEIKCTSLLPMGPNDPKPEVIPSWQKKAITWLESKWLQKVVSRRMGELTKVYNFYSLLLSKLEMPNFKFCMHRLSLWLLMKHCGLHETGLTTTQLDRMVGGGHDPFDTIMMYEMINYLLTVSWLRYVPKRIKNPDIPGIIAPCFDKFIEEVVVSAPSKYDGNFHTFLQYTPFDSLIKLYSTFEYPMRIEDLCARLLQPSSREFKDKLPFTPPYYKYIMQGKNIIGPDSCLSYKSYEVPYFDLHKMKLKKTPIPTSDLRVLGLIGIDNIVRSIKEAVPEAANPINDELIIDFELSFNDFCNILVNLVTVYLNMSQDYYRKILNLQDGNTDNEHKTADPKGAIDEKEKVTKKKLPK